MSDNWIHLIPVSPDFVPRPPNIDRAIPIVAEAWPTLQPRVLRTKKAEFERSWPDVVIQVVVRDEIEFVFGMENFEGAFCPFCGTRIDDHWWGDAFDHASKIEFRDLAIVSPCCGRSTNLNDLDYRFPAGFARFSLSVHDPNLEGFSSTLFRRIGEALGSEIRQVWEHL